MSKLLLPYALDKNNSIIHINDAVKGEKYKCPSCGSELLLRLSKIPEGQKYHRTNHFAHKGGIDNHCSESFLHRLFKQKATEFIKSKINAREPFFFEWDCEQCYEHHKGNLLKKAVEVVEEYDLGVCRPDIALLDTNGDVVIVIEVIVTHEPEPEVLDFYNSKRIACLQIRIDSFDDCKKIEEKLSSPSFVNLCPTPSCEKCGQKKDHVFVDIFAGPCWRCGRELRIADITSFRYSYNFEDLPNDLIDLVKEKGVTLDARYSKTTESTYIANICPHCNSMIGNFYLHEYTMEGEPLDSIDLGYICGNCIEKEKRKIAQEQYQIKETRENKLRQLMSENRSCPYCGRLLRIRNGNKGLFWGCSGYPSCKYTEGINLE